MKTDAERIADYLQWRYWSATEIQAAIDDAHPCVRGSKYDIIKRTAAMLDEVRKEAIASLPARKDGER